MDYYRDTWVEVNLDAISSNVSHLKEHLPKNVQIMAVVKADGYGHGALEVAEAAVEAGATWLGVALLDEALALRKAGIRIPILVLGWTRPEDVSIASKHMISLTVFQKEWLQKAQALHTSPHPVLLHIKMDTGMGRIGIKTKAELVEVIEAMRQDKRFFVEGAFTHFATADEPENAFFYEQNKRFDTFLGWLKELGINPNLIHSANTATALRKVSNLYNMVRFGISMYGLAPSPSLKRTLPFPIKEAFSLYSELVHVKQVQAGEGVGYGSSFIAPKKMWVGTIPIGYADGWIRQLTGTDLIIKGRKVKIIGRICMDQLMVELDQPYEVSEKVTLLGEGNPIDLVAEKLNTINYEVPCMISARVPRIYLKNGKKIKVKNPILY
jgi:alanine racemase